VTEPLTNDRLAEIVGYYCDHSDEPWDARTHHDWEWIEGEGLVFTHQPDTISSHGGADRQYLAEEKRGIRCSRAQAVYPAATVTGLLAENAELRTQLATAERQARDLEDRYVGNEPTVAEEMAYLNRCLNAVFAVCALAEKQAIRWENPLPVPEWIASIRKAAGGESPVEDEVASLKALLAERDATIAQLRHLADTEVDERAVPA